MALADYSSHGDIAVIMLSNPPVNALGLAVRKAIAEGLERAANSEFVGAVVITGAGAMFCGGADVSEFGSPAMIAAPNLADLFAMIEDFPKPVIAAINGTALGGGLELAMACHYRLATAAAQLGLPEVKLGILPGAGGTQRLPRLVGAERALNMIVSGNPLTARELANTDLLDSVVEAEVLPAAIAFCQHGAGGKLPLKKARDVRINFQNAEAFFDFARGAVAAFARNYPAPGKCIDAVEAAVLKPFEVTVAVRGFHSDEGIGRRILRTPSCDKVDVSVVARELDEIVETLARHVCGRQIDRVIPLPNIESAAINSNRLDRRNDQKIRIGVAVPVSVRWEIVRIQKISNLIKLCNRFTVITCHSGRKILRRFDSSGRGFNRVAGDRNGRAGPPRIRVEHLIVNDNRFGRVRRQRRRSR